MSTILKNQIQSKEISLRQQNQINSNTHGIHQLRQQQSHSLSKTEIIVSDLPTSFTNSYEEIVKYTFDAIGASQLLIQVLGIIRFINKPPQQNSNPPSNFLLAVHVTGHDIALRLISLKMNFKELKLSQVFKNPALEGLLYLNILHPPNIYLLLKKPRTVARSKNTFGFILALPISVMMIVSQQYLFTAN